MVPTDGKMMGGAGRWREEVTKVRGKKKTEM